MRPSAPIVLPLASVLVFSPLAAADEARQAPEEAYDYAPARTGFQLGVRWSAQIPSGSLGGSANFSDLLGPRMHLAFDVGSRLEPHFFLGGYAGFSYGSEGGDFSSACDATDALGDTVSCTAESVDAGIVGIVSFLPSAFIDPWVGATLGYEIQGLDYGGVSGLFTGVSPTLLGGFDFRIRNGDHKGIMSLGPYVGVTAQKYVTSSLTGGSLDAGSEPFHTWFHVGLRLTFPS